MASKLLQVVLKLDSAQFKAGLKDVGEVASGVGASAAALGIAMAAVAKQTADFQDRAIKSARAVGVSVESFSSLSHAATMSGLSQEQLSAAMGKLVVPSDQMAKAMGLYGQSLRNADGSIKSTDESLRVVADTMKSFKTPVDQAKFAVQVFGEEGKQLVSLLKDGSAGLDKFTAEAKAMGLVVSQEAAVAAEKFNDDLTRLTGSMQGMTNALGTSIIAWVNQNKIIETATAVVQSAVKWWNEIDDSTKNIGLTIAAVAIGIGLFVGALGSIILIAPVVGTAMTAAFGPVGITIMAVTAAAVGLGAAFALLTDRSEEQSKAAQDSARRYEVLVQKHKELEARAKTNAMAAQQLNSVNKEMIGIERSLGLTIADSNKPLAERARLAKEAALAKSVEAFNTMLERSLDLGVRIRDTEAEIARMRSTGQDRSLGAYMLSLTANLINMRGEYNRLSAAMAQMLSVQRDMRSGNLLTGQSFRDLGGNTEKVTNAWQEMFRFDPVAHLKNIKAEIEFVDRVSEYAAENGITDMDEALAKFKEHTVEAAKSQLVLQEALDISAAVGKYGSSLGAAAGAAKQVVDANVADMQRGLDKTMSRFSNFSAVVSAIAAQQIEEFRQSEDLRLENFEKNEDLMLESLRESEQRKLNLLAAFSNERLLQQDAEYQAAKEKADAEHQAFLLAERMRFEAKLAQLDEFNLTEEERRATKAVMEENWLLYKEQLERDHETNIAEIGKEFAGIRKGVEVSIRADEEAAKKASNDLIEQEERDSKQRIEDERKASNARLEQMEKDKADKEKMLARAQAFTKWRAEATMLQSKKGVESAATLAAGISGAAQAFASLAWIPIVGIPLGLAASAAIMYATSRSIHQIQTAAVMPPYEAMLASGGVLKSSIMGGSAAGDVIPARLTPGESVIDVERTKKFEAFIDSDTGRQPTILIYNYNQGWGSIDEDGLDRLGRELSYRVVRERAVR